MIQGRTVFEMRNYVQKYIDLSYSIKIKSDDWRIL